MRKKKQPPHTLHFRASCIEWIFRCRESHDDPPSVLKRNPLRVRVPQIEHLRKHGRLVQLRLPRLLVLLHRRGDTHRDRVLRGVARLLDPVVAQPHLRGGQRQVTEQHLLLRGRVHAERELLGDAQRADVDRHGLRRLLFWQSVQRLLVDEHAREEAFPPFFMLFGGPCAEHDAQLVGLGVFETLFGFGDVDFLGAQTLLFGGFRMEDGGCVEEGGGGGGGLGGRRRRRRDGS